MRLSQYLIERKTLIIYCVLISVSALMIFGVSGKSTLLVQVIWMFILIYMGYDYFINHAYFKSIRKIAHIDIHSNTEESTILSLPKPWTQEQILFNDCLEQLNEHHRYKYEQLRNIQMDYEMFVNVFVHEMKSPLTALKLQASKIEDHSEQIGYEVMRLNELLETALVYSKHNTLHQDMKVDQVRLLDLVKKAIALRAEALIDNDISVETLNLDEWVYADEKWIPYVIGQILLNAITHKAYKIKNISIEFSQLDGYGVLSITDDGIGMHENELKRVFQKGFSGSTGRLSHGSSGLGMYLSRRICRRLGLELSVDSVLGQYTSFKIERLRLKLKDY